MPVGMFRSEEGWAQVDYGTGNIPIPRSKYEENKYKPDFDKLPSEAEYWAAEKKKEDDAKGSQRREASRRFDRRCRHGRQHAATAARASKSQMFIPPPDL